MTVTAEELARIITRECADYAYHEASLALIPGALTAAQAILARLQSDEAKGEEECPNPNGCPYCAEFGCPRGETLASRPTTPEAQLAEEMPAPNPEWEAKAKASRDELRAEAGDPEPEMTLKMLQTWTADCQPANELGQISMARSMLESAEDALVFLTAQLAARDALIAKAREAMKPFANLFDKRWLAYPNAPEKAPLSIGFSINATDSNGLKLEDFRVIRSTLAEMEGK